MINNVIKVWFHDDEVRNMWQTLVDSMPNVWIRQLMVVVFPIKDAKKHWSEKVNKMFEIRFEDKDADLTTHLTPLITICRSRPREVLTVGHTRTHSGCWFSHIFITETGSNLWFVFWRHLPQLPVQLKTWLTCSCSIANLQFRLASNSCSSLHWFRAYIIVTRIQILKSTNAWCGVIWLTCKFQDN
jgi:hypothetical protein